MNLWRSLSARRRAFAITGASVLVAGGLVTIPVTAAQAATQCSIDYTTNDWSGGFTGSVTIRNVGDPISSWNLGFTFPNSSQRVVQGWSAKWSQSGQNVTVTNESYNGSLASGGSATIGFNGSWSGSNPKPTSFTLNGVVCNGGVTPTTPPPTTPPPTTPPPDHASAHHPAAHHASAHHAPPGQKVDNPYAGAKGYVNPEWKAKADAEAGGSRVSNNPTAVWLDRIAAINGTADSSSNGAMGVTDHLDAALAQGAGYIQFVIYNLPGRDCSALASNGELRPDRTARYKAEYIDPIAAIQGDPKYASLRIINIIEIDSLPNLVTNTSGNAGGTAQCDMVKANGAYVNGVGYALSKLGAIGNVYNYIDAGHHGWLGWDTNFGPTADVLKAAAVASGSTVNNVHGFITNTANYSRPEGAVLQDHRLGERHRPSASRSGSTGTSTSTSCPSPRRSAPSWSRSASTATSAC